MKIRLIVVILSLVIPAVVSASQCTDNFTPVMLQKLKTEKLSLNPLNKEIKSLLNYCRVLATLTLMCVTVLFMRQQVIG
jgi:hypothetical protein